MDILRREGLDYCRNWRGSVVSLMRSRAGATLSPLIAESTKLIVRRLTGERSTILVCLGVREKSLVGHDHAAADGIKHKGVEVSEVSAPDRWIIAREHFFWLSPRTVALE